MELRASRGDPVVQLVSRGDESSAPEKPQLYRPPLISPETSPVSGAAPDQASSSAEAPQIRQQGSFDPQVLYPEVSSHSQAAFGSRRPASFLSGSELRKQGSACTDAQDQQCAEEECDPDECGDEKRPPLDSVDCLGNDKRPYLPVALFGSTLFEAIHMMMLQFPLIRDMCGGAYQIRWFFLAVYAVTLSCMVYCVLCDPGKWQRDDMEAYAQLHQMSEGEDLPMPHRCHKMWLFKQPIRRYDHYCRWLTNAIGLLNHREFAVMTGGFATIGVCGALLDFILVVATSSQGHHFFTVFLLLMHLTYSLLLSALAVPILRLHAGFICRNELANEWKQNLFYVVRDERGKPTPVNELDEETFNDHFDNERFEYEPSMNSWDKGWEENCLAFWCVPRWPTNQRGDF